MQKHLPPDEILADYACGSTSPGVSLLIATHLSQVPESREKVAEFEHIGGIVMTEENPVEMSSGALDKVLGLLDAQDAVTQPMQKQDLDGSPFPAPLRDMLGMSFSKIPWKFRLPGVSVYDFDGFGDEKVQILRAKPGASVPQHTHHGPELTLVMQGVLVDGENEYRAGDVAVNDEDDDHRPRIGGDELCYCLIVQQGDLHFTGRFSRFLNYFGE